jgi:hypothetical protein
MGLFVFAYDNQEDVRESVLNFLNENGATEIEQCLNTTYKFKSRLDVIQWKAKIERSDLNLNFFLINEVLLGERENKNGQRLYEIAKKCNLELKQSAQEILDNLDD